MPIPTGKRSKARLLRINLPLEGPLETSCPTFPQPGGDCYKKEGEASGQGAIIMAQAGADPETILIVDDEDAVRRTFREWLEGAGLDCRILAAADAEGALVQANRHMIDL